VFSDEPVKVLTGAACDPGAGLACAGYGSTVTVTAPLGFAMAACAMRWLARSAADATGSG
jgi:hypothetical protein